ncbi:hypothetical protein IEO21_00520 [Rhodonia placenta]|uniref:HMG box domain-containing protein n=1 Tax=Rhodonia placenta TaxID=104341 RepID=A0A8H7U6V1_9APHY|nr:hypothetical protein IEO21_00520 [Postia placenta]
MHNGTRSHSSSFPSSIPARTVLWRLRSTNTSTSSPVVTGATTRQTELPSAITVEQVPLTRPAPLESGNTCMSSPGMPATTGDIPYPSTPYNNATSRWRAQRNRERDPTWVPRPPNAFIIFRSEYSRKHAHGGANKAEEKTLSKRAGEKWKTLSDAEKKPYKLRAEQERADHQKRNPGYKYRPRRGQNVAGNVSGPMSRREQVESFLRRTVSQDNSLSESDSASGYTTPSSPTSFESSSPEPSDTLLSCSSSPTRSARSLSRPPTHEEALHNRLQQSVFLSPAYTASSPTLGLRAGSLWDGSEGLSSILPSPSAVLDIPAWSNSYPSVGEDTQSARAIGASLSPSTSYPHDESLGMLAFGGPGIHVAAVERTQASLTLPEDSRMDWHATCPPASPLLRRRRAATASAALPSPLTVVTSSLANWSGDGPSAVDPLSLGTYLATRRPSLPITPYAGVGIGMSQQPSTLSGPTAGFATAGFDLDRTPRSSEFPRDVQGHYPPPQPNSIGSFAYMQGKPTSTMTVAGGSGENGTGLNTYIAAETDFVSYTMGLAELGIEPVVYNMSPFEDLDINEFFNFEHVP